MSETQAQSPAEQSHTARLASRVNYESRTWATMVQRFESTPGNPWVFKLRDAEGVWLFSRPDEVGKGIVDVLEAVIDDQGIEGAKATEVGIIFSKDDEAWTTTMVANGFDVDVSGFEVRQELTAQQITTVGSTLIADMSGE